MLKIYSVYEQSMKSESRNANYNANQCIVMNIVEKFIDKRGGLIKSALQTQYVLHGQVLEAVDHAK